MAGSRRDKGDGSLRKLPSGKWEGRYSYFDREGNRRQPQITADTWSEAKAKLRALIDKIQDEQQQAENPDHVERNKILFKEWLDIWLEEILPNSVEPSTLESYYRNVEKYIKPELGGYYLQSITSDQIQKLINKCRKVHNHKPWTLTKLKMVISSAFSDAMEQTPPLVKYNPCTGVKTPTIQKSDVRALTNEEQDVFVEAIAGTRLETLFLTALATGMRRGELIALTWDCVDFIKRQIFVKGSVGRVRDPATGKMNLQYGTPKTASSRRKVPVIESLIPVLKAHKDEQNSVREQAGAAWNEKNLVFCSVVGEWLEPRRIRSNLDDVINTAGLEHFSFHSLRHTFATRMLEKEVPAKVVSEILGHRDVKTTLDIYSQVFDTTAHDQAAKLNDLFADKVQATPGDDDSRKAHYPQLRKKPQSKAPKPPARGGRKSRGGDAR